MLPLIATDIISSFHTPFQKKLGCCVMAESVVAFLDLSVFYFISSILAEFSLFGNSNKLCSLTVVFSSVPEAMQ